MTPSASNAEKAVVIHDRDAVFGRGVCTDATIPELRTHYGRRPHPLFTAKSPPGARGKWEHRQHPESAFTSPDH